MDPGGIGYGFGPSSVVPGCLAWFWEFPCGWDASCGVLGCVGVAWMEASGVEPGHPGVRCGSGVLGTGSGYRRSLVTGCASGCWRPVPEAEPHAALGHRSASALPGRVCPRVFCACGCCFADDQEEIPLGLLLQGRCLQTRASHCWWLRRVPSGWLHPLLPRRSSGPQGKTRVHRGAVPSPGQGLRPPHLLHLDLQGNELLGLVGEGLTGGQLWKALSLFGIWLQAHEAGWLLLLIRFLQPSDHRRSLGSRMSRSRQRVLGTWAWGWMPFADARKIQGGMGAKVAGDADQREVGG